MSDEDGIADAHPGLNRVSNVPSQTGPIVACDTLVVLPLVIPGVGPPVPKRKARRDRVRKLAAQWKHLAVYVVIALRDRTEVARLLRSGVLPQSRSDDPCGFSFRWRYCTSVHFLLCLNVSG